MTKKAVIYIRVSTAQQDRGYSKKEQKDALERWAEKEGYTVIGEPYDDTKSGREKTTRESLNRMKHDAEGGEFDAIFCYHNDRLSRNMREAVDLIDDYYHKYNVRVYFYNLRHINIYTSEGKMMLTDMMKYAEYFGEQHGDKVSMGLKKKMETEWVGKAPYGYCVKSDTEYYKGKPRQIDSRLKKNPKEYRIIKKIMKLHKTGETVREIVKILNADFDRTREGNLWYNRIVKCIIEAEESGKYEKYLKKKE